MTASRDVDHLITSSNKSDSLHGMAIEMLAACMNVALHHVATCKVWRHDRRGEPVAPMCRSMTGGLSLTQKSLSRKSSGNQWQRDHF